MPTPNTIHRSPSTVRFLISSPSTRPTKLLRFTPSIIRHEQRPIVLHQRLLQLILHVFIDVFLVVSDDGFRNSLANGVNLACMATPSHAHADVNTGEFFGAEDKDGFVDLESQVRKFVG
jgi:hypothetical protein